MDNLSRVLMLRKDVQKFIAMGKLDAPSGPGSGVDRVELELFDDVRSLVNRYMQLAMGSEVVGVVRSDGELELSTNGVLDSITRWRTSLAVRSELLHRIGESDG